MKKGNNKKMKILIAGLVAVALVLAGVFIYYQDSLGPVSTKSTEVEVDIPKNTTGNQVLTILKKKNLIKNLFTAKIYLKTHKYNIKSNTYLLNKTMSLSKIFKILEGNDAKYISNTKLTIQDGKRIPDIAITVAKALNITSEEVIQKWADQTYLNKLIKKYWFLDNSILNSDLYYPLEGFLAPETYQLTAEDNLESVTEMMLNQTGKVLKTYKKQIEKMKIQNSKITIFQFVTLASIVQAESPGDAKNQKLIAGVLLNRLNKPMKLQSDVTVNYGNRETKLAVTTADLQKDTKYNTYLYAGLPVGPISTISPKIIASTLNYTTSDYYFFFGTKDGGVIFSKTYEEHLQVIAENKWY